jgi:hypothetical protein
MVVTLSTVDGHTDCSEAISICDPPRRSGCASNRHALADKTSTAAQADAAGSYAFSQRDGFREQAKPYVVVLKDDADLMVRSSGRRGGGILVLIQEYSLDRRQAAANGHGDGNRCRDWRP